MALWKNGAFVEDPWRTSAGDDANPPLAGGVILSLAEWKATRTNAGAAGINTLLGIRLEAGEMIDEILPDLHKFAMIALSFPKMGDGRSFSKARLLRLDHGFTGELRAVGDVLWDQMQLMARCGFDAFEITNEPTLAALRAGKKRVMTDYYQPGFGPETRAGVPRAWARRAVP